MNRISPRVFENLKKKRFIPSLKGVTVHVWGCHASGKSGQYWEELKDFWQSYFRAAGAQIGVYSNLRDIRKEIYNE